ncbi:MAG: hypothetical protein JST11_23400 [Acidobacteria bacterium]|nr:hypothetical protein [Acidobacteriota bacterium]
MRRLAWILCVPLVAAAQDARDIVRRSLEVDKHNSEVARNYTFVQRQQQRDIDSSGRVKKVESDTWDVTLLEGSPYRRKIAHDDKPLSAKDQAKEEANLRRSIEDRRKETPEQKARRIQEWRRKQDKQREPLREIPDAFDLKLAGEEKVDGVDAWVIDATPHPGYRPRSTTASFFPKVKARFWIAKQDYQWVKIDMVSLDTISFGGFLIRMAKGSHLEFEAAHVNNEVWLPRRAVLKGSVRIALIKVLRGDISFEFSDYKKFQAESRVLPIAQ